MALITEVWLKNISNLSDARYAAGMGVQTLGIHMDPASSFHLSASEVQALRSWIVGPAFVGQYDSPPNLSALRESMKTYGFENIEIEAVPLITEMLQEAPQTKIFACYRVKKNPQNPATNSFPQRSRRYGRRMRK